LFLFTFLANVNYRDCLIWNLRFTPYEHLTDTKKYVIIVIKYSGIYNIPIIPPVVTCTIFEKGKQEVFGRAYAPTMCNNILSNDVTGIIRVDVRFVSTVDKIGEST